MTGGFSLAASWTGGIETVAFCEIEPYCQKVLKKHWPDVPIFPDIKELRGEDIGSVDIVCGGFPCQPFSCAGKQRGKEDDRYLWPEMFRIIQETKPAWVVGENVTGLIELGLEDCFLNLETEGYEVQTFIIPACGVDAPHRRNRVWIMAWNTTSNRNATFRKLWQRENSLPIGICETVGHSKSNDAEQLEKRNTRREGEIPQENGVGLWTQPSRSGENLAHSPGVYVEGLNNGQGEVQPWGSGWWAIEPDVGRVAHGIPARVDRLKGLGNSIVPQVAFQILQGIVEIESQAN